jgi:hypothetical protein
MPENENSQTELELMASRGEVQRVDVRLYFDADAGREDLLNRISLALQESAELCDMAAAYPLVSDGFGRLVPDDRPLA